jgi:hypothetical protein
MLMKNSASETNLEIVPSAVISQTVDSETWPSYKDKYVKDILCETLKKCTP